MTPQPRQSSASRQVPGLGRAMYELAGRPSIEPDECRFCGCDIVNLDGRWVALEARWPNLGHCHYSARNGASVGHAPEEG